MICSTIQLKGDEANVFLKYNKNDNHMINIIKGSFFLVSQLQSHNFMKKTS